MLNSCTFLRGKGGKKNPAMLRPELGAAEKCLQLNPAWFYLPRTAAKIKEHRQMQNLLLVKLHCELLTLISKQEKSCSFLKYLSYRKQKGKKVSRLSCRMALMGHIPVAYSHNSLGASGLSSAEETPAHLATEKALLHVISPTDSSGPNNDGFSYTHPGKLSPLHCQDPGKGLCSLRHNKRGI